MTLVMIFTLQDQPSTGRDRTDDWFLLRGGIGYPSGNRPYPSHLLQGVGVHGPLGQQAVSLAQGFPQLADGFVRLLLGCTLGPVDPAFEVGGSAFS
jgi:hypothetical protein